MSDHFNQLTPAEAERLAMLAEECGEVIQVVGKILRHGYASCHPANLTVTNKELLVKELQDVNAVLQEMGKFELINANLNNNPRAIWEKKLWYTHHQIGSRSHDR